MKIDLKPLNSLETYHKIKYGGDNKHALLMEENMIYILKNDLLRHGSNRYQSSHYSLCAITMKFNFTKNIFAMF
jgi:hypothetical protein